MRLLTLLLLLQQPIDINTATKEQLTSLPAVTPKIADRIINGRPYKTVDDVQGSVPRFEFDKIRPRIYVAPIYVAPNPIRVAPSPSQVSRPLQVVPERKPIQVIQGNKVENLVFEKKEQTAPVQPVETK